MSPAGKGPAHESAKAWQAFNSYLAIGHRRTLRQVSEDGGHSVTGVRKWSSQHDWRSRAAAYDQAALERDIAGREKVRERARQSLIDDIEDAAETLRGVRSGKVPMPECGDDCTIDKCVCGVWTPIQDRHGRAIGRKPTVTAATRQGAAVAILDRCGLMPPKRVELSGKDGEALREQGALMLGMLDTSQIVALMTAFAPVDADG